MSFNIYSKLKTTLRREEILDELDKLASGTYSGSGASVNVEAPVCKECGIDASTSQDELQALRKSLIDCIVVKVTTAAFPDEQLLDVIYSNIFNPSYVGLLELSVDESIKGGVVVYLDGRVFDYSLSNLVGGLFKSSTFQQKLSSLV